MIKASIFDPLGRPTGPAGSDHYFHTYFRTSVHTVQNIAKQNKHRVKIMITTVGLAEGIIDKSIDFVVNSLLTLPSLPMDRNQKKIKAI